MAEYYEIKINDFWLTRDGTEQVAGIGNRAALEVDGIPGLQGSYRLTRVNDFRGNPIINKTEVGKAGREIVIRVLGKISPAVADMITAAHNSAIENDTVIRVSGTEGDTPDFLLDCLPDGDDHFTWTGFAFGYYNGVILKYVAVGDTFLTWTENLIWGGDRLTWDS